MGYSTWGSKELGTSESTELAQAHIHISIPLQIIFPFMLLQNFWQSCLWFCSRSLWLFILDIVVSIYIFDNPHLPIHPPAPT